MLTRDERLRYLEKIEAAQATLLTDPEVAAEYLQASQAWDSTIRPAIVEEPSTDQVSTKQQTNGRRQS